MITTSCLPIDEPQKQMEYGHAGLARSLHSSDPSVHPSSGLAPSHSSLCLSQVHHHHPTCFLLFFFLYIILCLSFVGSGPLRFLPFERQLLPTPFPHFLFLLFFAFLFFFFIIIASFCTASVGPVCHCVGVALVALGRIAGRKREGGGLISLGSDAGLVLVVMSGCGGDVPISTVFLVFAWDCVFRVSARCVEETLTDEVRMPRERKKGSQGRTDLSFFFSFLFYSVFRGCILSCFVVFIVSTIIFFLLISSLLHPSFRSCFIHKHTHRYSSRLKKRARIGQVDRESR